MGFPLSKRDWAAPELGSWFIHVPWKKKPRIVRGRSGCGGDAVPASLDPRSLHGLSGSGLGVTESLRTGRSGGCAEDGCRVTGMGGTIVCSFC